MQPEGTGDRIADAVARLDPHGFVPGVHAGIWFVVDPQVLRPVSRGTHGEPRAWLRVACVALCRDGMGRGLDFRHRVTGCRGDDLPDAVAEEVGTWGGAGDGECLDRFVAGLGLLEAALAAAGSRAREVSLARAAGALVGMPADDPALASACRASTRRLSMRATACLAALDPVAVRLALDNRAVGGILAKCWPGLDRRLSPDAPLAAALARMPAHPLALAEAWLADPGGFRAGMAAGRLDRLVGERVVASGHLPARLVPTLARVDRVVRADVDVVGLRGGEPLEHPSSRYGLPLALARRLSALPAGWEPADDAECEAFIRLVPVVDRATALARGVAVPALLNAGGRWDRYAERLRGAAGGRDPLDAMDDLRDVARAFLRQVVGPAALSAGMARGGLALGSAWTDAAWKLLWSGRSLPRMLEVSARWHRMSDVLEAAWMGALSAGGGTPPWGAGLPCATYGDIRIEVLTDDASLVAEGSRHAHDGTPGLCHCVGGYGPDCRSAVTRVASVRRLGGDGSWARLSTVAFDVRGPTHPVVSQHRGRDNEDPAREAVEAVARYVREIRQGTLAVDRAGLSRVAEPTAPGWSGSVPLDDGPWASVRDAWAPLLPGPLRGLEAPDLAVLARASLSSPGTLWVPETPGTPAYAARTKGAPGRPLPV